METVTVTSNNKDDAYTSTVLLFNNVKQMAMHNIGRWELVESFTSADQEIFETKYSNGKMWIKAYSIFGNHKYSFGAES
ncbi:hypothetical protein NVP1291O_06 [Vibrio phage 1.291.O._10N.286.55.F6]|nr:hypothetical protein NVP1291O_06 [Vibrio phage 1.291.O._10N.286.55.F6]